MRRIRLTTLSLLWMVAVLFAVAACGGGGDSIYDTAGNPDGFPEEALALIKGVESGRLNSVASVSEAFAGLYLAHPELLDQPPWNEVIGQLGGKFQRLADSAYALGLRGYAQAGEYYTLASFAQPDDSETGKRAARLAGWTQAVRDEAFDVELLTGDDMLSLEGLVAITRRLVLADEETRAFFEETVLPRLQEKIDQQGLFSEGAPEPLSPADRVLLIAAGVLDIPLSDHEARFVEPTIDLAAYRVESLDSLLVFELYFVPRDSLASDPAVICQTMSPRAGRPAPLDVLLELQQKSGGWFTIGDWQRDRVTIRVDTVGAGLDDSWPTVGLAVKRDHWEWLRVDGIGGNVYRLDVERTPTTGTVH